MGISTRRLAPVRPTIARPCGATPSGRGTDLCRLVVSVAALALLAVAVPAEAHQQGVSYSEISFEDGRVRYDLTLSNHDVPDADTDANGVLTDDEILSVFPALRRLFDRAIIVEAGGARCPLSLEDFSQVTGGGGVLFRLRGTCSDEPPIRVRFGLLALAGSDGYDFAKIRWRDRLEERIFTRDTTEVVLDESGGVRATVRRFFLLGVEHIATGYDHILFLVALLLVSGGIRSLVGIVSAFTVAHSITLALATLEIVTLPSRPVEAVIALSIAWVALENVVFDRSAGRWRITFAFGLVHGFGFATVLRGLHLPSRELAASLLAFNLGVEAGQVVVVLLFYPIIAAIQRAPQRRAIVGVCSGLILAIALFWFVERTFS